MIDFLGFINIRINFSDIIVFSWYGCIAASVVYIAYIFIQYFRKKSKDKRDKERMYFRDEIISIIRSNNLDMVKLVCETNATTMKSIEAIEKHTTYMLQKTAEMIDMFVKNNDNIVKYITKIENRIAELENSK